MFWRNKRKIDFSWVSSDSRHSQKVALKNLNKHLSSWFTLEENRAQRSYERELERRSGETRTFLTTLPQSPFRWITLLFVARRSHAWSLRSSSLTRVTQRWACSQAKMTRLSLRLVRNLKPFSGKRNRPRPVRHSIDVSNILLISSFQPVL